ncbi:MAG: hypothetical protein WBC18_16945 [Ottowia sp.]|uniref:hypothetical protein n=1 Tax=Ottowia sp. TaxID=1898956 RepID=UPI003C772B3C
MSGIHVITSDSHISTHIATGVIYLTHVGPFFGFFGLGFTQYCAAQGTGVMWKPLSGAMVRTLITITGGYLASTLAGLFACVALGMTAFGMSGLLSLRWRSRDSAR